MYMIVATYNNLHVTIASGNNFNKNFKTCTDHNQDIMEKILNTPISTFDH